MRRSGARLSRPDRSKEFPPRERVPAMSQQVRPDNSAEGGATRRQVLTGHAGSVASVGLLAPAAAEGQTARPERDPRVEALLKQMTLAEKIGQLQLVGDETTARTALASGRLGGVFSVVGA